MNGERMDGPSTVTKFRENCGERASDILPKACKVRASELISGTRPLAMDKARLSKIPRLLENGNMENPTYIPDWGLFFFLPFSYDLQANGVSKRSRDHEEPGHRWQRQR